MAYLLAKPRQLAPTVGHNTSGAWIQSGSAFAGISDTIAIGRVLYDSGFPIVLADNLWVPARENPARFTIVLIGDINIFIGETNPTPAMETNFWRIGMAILPPPTSSSSHSGLPSFPKMVSRELIPSTVGYLGGSSPCNIMIA
jgi:hypothetical protein